MPSSNEDLGQIDRFPLIAKIGEGGFGAVYLAFDPLLGDTVSAKVAIKVLLDDRAEHRERFLQEAQLMRQLRGHGIVSVHEFGEYESPGTGQIVPYLVMEYCERGTLADRLNEIGRRLTLDEGLGLIEAIATSARTLAIPRPGHPNGIVHRDLKPTNFLIQRVEDRGRKSVGDLLKADEHLILTDFSIAKSTDPTATRLTHSGGTPAYSAPEQFYREDTGGNAQPPRSDVGPTVDVYAASVVVLSAMSNSFREDSTHYGDTEFAATGVLGVELRRGMSSHPRERHANFDQWRDALVASHARSRWNRRAAKIAIAFLTLTALALLGWFITEDEGPSIDTAVASSSTAPTTLDNPTTSNTTVTSTSQTSVATSPSTIQGSPTTNNGLDSSASAETPVGRSCVVKLADQPYEARFVAADPPEACTDLIVWHQYNEYDGDDLEPWDQGIAECYSAPQVVRIWVGFELSGGQQGWLLLPSRTSTDLFTEDPLERIGLKETAQVNAEDIDAFDDAGLAGNAFALQLDLPEGFDPEKARDGRHHLGACWQHGNREDARGLVFYWPTGVNP